MTMTQIDYTGRDYDSLRADFVRRLQTAIPDWTTYDAGFESIIVDLFSLLGDQLNFYIDRMGNEAFPQTAVLRESILNLAEMFGYIPSPQTAATCTLQFTRQTGFVGDITIPAGTRVYAQAVDEPPIFFETNDLLVIAAVDSTDTILASEGTTVSDEVIGVSSGLENQSFPLYYPKVIKDSVRVYTLDGPVDPVTNQPSAVEWTKVDRLIDANFADLAFTIYVDEDNFTQIRFGDGVSGVIPSTNSVIKATYRYGVGVDGNVGVGAVRSLVEGTLSDMISAVTNTTAAQGGADVETIDAMRSSIPQSLRSLERAVTLEDYAALCLKVPGVAKAFGEATVDTNVTVYIAPLGGWVVDGTGADGQPTTSLLNAVQTYIDARKMIGTTVTLDGPTYVPINITVAVTVDDRYRQDLVVAGVEAALNAFLSFDNVIFGQLVAKANAFARLVAVPGVTYVNITVFSLTGSGTTDIQLDDDEIPLPGAFVITPTGGIV